MDWLCLFCLLTPWRPTHHLSSNSLSNCPSWFFLHILTGHLASCSAFRAQAPSYPPWFMRIKHSSESSHGINYTWFMQHMKWVNEEGEPDYSQASGLSANNNLPFLLSTSNALCRGVDYFIYKWQNPFLWDCVARESNVSAEWRKGMVFLSQSSHSFSFSKAVASAHRRQQYSMRS